MLQNKISSLLGFVKVEQRSPTTGVEITTIHLLAVAEGMMRVFFFFKPLLSR